MALRTANRLEVGQRVGWLRKQANLTHRGAAELLGINDPGLFGRIEKHGRSFDYERLAQIADCFAGKGQLLDDPEELFNFMIFHGEVGRVLRPRLKLVEEKPAGLRMTSVGSSGVSVEPGIARVSGSESVESTAEDDEEKAA